MLKNILNLEGTKRLSKYQQSAIMGGVDKCCILKIPTHGLTEGFEEAEEEHKCNSRPACCNSRCACSTNTCS